MMATVELLSSFSQQNKILKKNDGNCHHPLCNKSNYKKDDGNNAIIFIAIEQV
jgi:hypothetical protein